MASRCLFSSRLCHLRPPTSSSSSSCSFQTPIVHSSTSFLQKTTNGQSSKTIFVRRISTIVRRNEHFGLKGGNGILKKSTWNVSKRSLFSWSEVKKLGQFAKPEARNLGYGVGLLLISSSITMSIPFGMGKIIDLVTKGTTKEFLFYVGAGLSTIFIIGAAANFGRIVIMRTAAERIILNIRKKVFSSIMRQEIGFFDQNRTGELISRLASDTSIVGKSLTTNISDGLRALASATVGISMMGYTSPTLTMIMLTIIPPMALGAAFYGRYIKRLSKQTQEALSSASKVAEERFSSIRTVRAFAQEDKELSRYSNEIDNVYDLAKKDAIASAMFYSGVGVAGNLMVVGILMAGGNLVMQEILTIGQLTSFLLYTAYVGSSVAGLSSFYSEIQKGIGATYRIIDLIERKPKIPLTGGKILEHIDGQINFSNISFSYPTRSEVEIFNEFNLQVPSGSNVAVVGTSGSGKSTVAGLLLRYYDPTQGSITIDNVNIQELDPKWLRNQVGIVSQEPTLFATSITENISYGKEDVSIDEVKWAAERANASSFIENFPKGYETYVGERGVTLSGGQKQRIAIARALLKNPKILILDEATSALDAESEQLVQEALERLMTGRTVITIAHRLSTIKKANFIALISDGKIVEFGTYDNLLRIPEGKFKKLIDRQMETQ